MAIYVDKITTYPTSMTRGLPGRDWCHLISDESDDELHAFAEKIGMKRAWAQLPPKASTPHYDLTPSRRAAAVKAGRSRQTATTSSLLCADVARKDSREEDWLRQEA